MSALKVSVKGSNFPLNHKYAPAVLATFNAAVNAIWTLNTCYQWEPELCMRISVLWQNCTSCTVSSSPPSCLIADIVSLAQLALCLILGRIPDSPFSQQILPILGSVSRLFHGVAPRCDTAARLLVSLSAPGPLCLCFNASCSVLSSRALTARACAIAIGAVAQRTRGTNTSRTLCRLLRALGPCPPLPRHQRPCEKIIRSSTHTIHFDGATTGTPRRSRPTLSIHTPARWRRPSGSE